MITRSDLIGSGPPADADLMAATSSPSVPLDLPAPPAGLSRGFLAALVVLGVYAATTALAYAADAEIVAQGQYSDTRPQAAALAVTATLVLMAAGVRALLAAGAPVLAAALAAGAAYGPLNAAIPQAWVPVEFRDVIDVRRFVVGAVVAAVLVGAAWLWQRRSPLVARPLSMVARTILLVVTVGTVALASAGLETAVRDLEPYLTDPGHGPLPLHVAVGWALSGLLLGVAAYVVPRGQAVLLVLLAVAVVVVSQLAYARSGGMPNAPGWAGGPLFATIGSAAWVIGAPLVGGVLGSLADRRARPTA